MNPPPVGQRIRVLTVIDGLGYAGDETRLLNMARGLSGARFEHSVLTLNRSVYGGEDEFQARLRQYTTSGIRVDDLDDNIPDTKREFPSWLGRIYAKTGIFRRAWRLAALVKKWNVNVIDARLPSAGLVSAIAGRLSGIPTCVTVYGGYNEDFQVAWPWTTRLMLRMATRAITDSRIRGEQMKSLLGHSQSKVLVIPNGIAVPMSSHTREEMRKALGLPADPSILVIGQVGRLIEYKGHEVLIRAARSVLEQEPKAVFLLVGYTRNESFKLHLRTLAEQLQIADGIVIREYPGDIADVWKAIDIHAHASLFDSLPISITEGMALGKPSVVTSTGGIPEMVTHERTGLVVTPGDSDELARALVRLIRKPEFARTLGERARERYLEFYTPERMVGELETAFMNCCDRT